MKQHVQKCEHIHCRGIEWGNETEYKYIGYEDNSIEGKKKTQCPEGKKINIKMKDLIK